MLQDMTVDTPVTENDTNTMTQNSIQVETLLLFRDIKRDTRSLNSDSSNWWHGGGGNGGNGGNNGGSNGTRRQIRKNPGDATFERCIKNK